MQRKKQKLWGIIAALIMAVSLIPATVFAAGGETLSQKYYSGDTQVWYTTDSNDNHVESVIFGTNSVDYLAKSKANNSASNGLKLKSVYGSNVNSAKEGTAPIKIKPKDGYYITKVVVACTDSSHNAFNCATWKNGKAFESSFTIDSGLNVELNLNSKSFGHDSNARKYFIIISTAKTPDPVYVVYDAGILNTVFTDNSWLSENKSQFSYAVSDSSPKHTIQGVSQSGIKEAAANEYEFTGWELQYYTTANVKDDIVSLSDEYGNSSTKNASDQITLPVHAKLTAQWKKIIPPAPVYSDVEISVKKEDNKGAPLAGAEFTLSGTGNYSGKEYTAISDKQGNATFTGINGEYGEYILRETKAPNKYNISDKSYTVIVEKEKVYILNGESKEEYKTITFVNTPIEPKIITVTVPITKQVLQTGTETPNKETFKFEAFDFGAKTNIKIISDTITTNGADVYNGNLKFTVSEDEIGNLSEGFFIREVKGGSDGWSYSDRVYHIGIEFDNDMSPVLNIKKAVKNSENGSYSIDEKSENETAAAFINSYEKNRTPEIVPVSVSVKKVWKLDDQGKQAKSVQVMLYKNGAAYSAPVELNSDNNWTHTWDSLDSSFTWTVDEINVPDGFTKSVSSQKSDNKIIFTITNDDIPSTSSGGSTSSDGGTSSSGNTSSDGNSSSDENISSTSSDDDNLISSDDNIANSSEPSSDSSVSSKYASSKPANPKPKSDISSAASGNLPKTGDNHILPWIATVLISGGVLGVIIAVYKKRKKTNVE